MPESDEPLRLGSKPRWGETTCGYGIDEPVCNKRAVWHLLWLESTFVSSTCDEHLAFVNSRPHPDYDIHTFSANCSMPGVLWHFPYEDEPEGYCLFPANDDASAMAMTESEMSKNV
ncbi:hypothetical protein [Rhodococcoides fascians]|uniref:hypothetical protein n=1 Tax=Rhodococcoides fascians TaxID=1828 RepID=UPI00050C6797|nr:hypothetical protein [Rhodococcus fascians]